MSTQAHQQQQGNQQLTVRRLLDALMAGSGSGGPGTPAVMTLVSGGTNIGNGALTTSQGNGGHAGGGGGK